MSFLDKLVRNEQALDVRPEELKKLFGGGKRKAREREQQEQQGEEDNASDRLAKVALGGSNPLAGLIETGQKLASGEQQQQEQESGESQGENLASNFDVGKLASLGKKLMKPELAAVVGGLDINVSAKPGLDGKKPKLPTHIEIGGNVLGADINAEADIDPFAKDKKLSAKAGASGNVAGVDLDGEVGSEDWLAKDKKVAAKGSASTNVAGVDLGGEVASEDITAKDKKVSAKGTASTNVAGVDLGGEVASEDITAKDKKVSAKATADGSLAGAQLHGEVASEDITAKDKKVSAKATADGTLAGAKLHGEVTSEDITAKDKKVAAKGTADGTLAGAKLHGEVTSEDITAKDVKVAAKGTADGKAAGLDLHGEVSTNDITDKDQKVDAKATADGKFGPAKVHGELVGEDLASEDRTVSGKATVDAKAGSVAKGHAEIGNEDITGDGKTTMKASADVKAGKVAGGHAEMSSEDLGSGKVAAKADGHIGKAKGETSTEDLFGAIGDALGDPAKKLATVAIDTLETALSTQDAGAATAETTKDGTAKADAKGDAKTDTKAGSKPADAEQPAADGTANAAQPVGAAAPSAAVANENAGAPVVAKATGNLGPGGKQLSAVVPGGNVKNAVGRWGANLDALDIGPDPENPRGFDGPAPAEHGADGIEAVDVAVAGVTLPKMTPRGPRPKIKPRLGDGDWQTAQAKKVQGAQQDASSRTSAASAQGEATSAASGTMAKSAVDQDASNASPLNAKASQAPTLVAKRGGRKPKAAAKQPAAVAKQPTAAGGKDPKEATPKVEPVAVEGSPSELGESLDGLVETAKAQLPGFLQPLADTLTKGFDGPINATKEIVNKFDPATRAHAAVDKVPGEHKSSVLGRLDAVSAVPHEQAQQFVESLSHGVQDLADGRAADAESITNKSGTPKAQTTQLHPATTAGHTLGEVAESFHSHNQRDAGSLKHIRDQAFAELAVDSPIGEQADLRDPQQRDIAERGPREHTLTAVSDDRGPSASPQQQSEAPRPAPAPSGPQSKNPQQTVHNAAQQARGVATQQGARTQQHAQHAKNREEEAKQRAAARKKGAAADKKDREEKLEASAPAQKAKMKAELTSHKDLAIQVLSMNKEQLAVEFERRLQEDVKALEGEVTQAKADVTKTWEDQKPKAIEANKKALVDIEKFCSEEKTGIDTQLATLSKQLKTNPEQAAKTAEEQGKDDCDRYGDTRDGNIERITDSAKEAADEQRRLGAEAYRIGMGKADRQDDPALKETAKKDAEAQKAHFEGQANKCVTDGASKAAAEKKKYDDLIAKRTESYKTTAKNIREKGIGYLEELKKSMEQAKLDIDKLKAESIRQANEQLAYDLGRIQTETVQEMKRLDLRLEERQIQIRQEIKYALNSMATLTEDQKKKMREDVERAHNDACKRIDECKANELNAMSLQLAECHSSIDKSLGALGSHTVKAVRQLSAFKQEFSEQVSGTVDSIKERGEAAIRVQDSIANTAKTTAGKLKSGAMDSVTGVDLDKRDVWTDVNAQKKAFDDRRKADAAMEQQRQAEMGQIGFENHKNQTKAKVEGASRKIEEAIGGWGLNPDTGAVMRELANLSPEEIAEVMKNPAIADRLKTLMYRGTMAPGDIARMNEMANAGTPEQIKAQVLDWSFNGGFTGMGYDDKTFKEVMKGMSPEERAEVDKNYKAKTGKSLDAEIDDEAWASSQNNRLMKANLKSDAAAIAEEKWQAAEGGFFRGVKDVVDAVPGGRFLTDPGGEIARGIGPMFGFKAPDHPLDQLAGYGMNQDAYIKQTDRIRELTEPPPGASAAEVSQYLQKRRDMMREIDGWLGANHNGLSLEKMDNSEANSDYNKFWMKDGDSTTFRNMLDAGRTGDWSKYSNNKAAYGAETTLGNRNWLKEEVEHRTARGDLKGLREFLSSRSEDGTFETFIDQNMPQKVDRGYFKSIAADPPPEKGTPAWRTLMANRLLYAQFGGRTGWGDDRAEMEKVISGCTKEELDAIRGEYSKLSGEYGLGMDQGSNQMQALTNPLGFFFLGNWSTGNLDNDVYLSNSGYMHDISGGLIGKGREYAMLEYDLKHGKPQTLEELMARKKYQETFDKSTGMLNMLRAAGIYDARGHLGEVADEKYAEMEAMYTKLKAQGLENMRLDDPRMAELSPEQMFQLAQFHQKMNESNDWSTSANANARSIVDGVVTIVTTTVTIIATAAITILTAGTATPFIVAALMAAGGAAMAGLAGMGVKMIMLGGAYGGNEAKMDFANLVIDSLVAGITAGQGISNFASKITGKLGISSKIAQELLTELIQNAIQSGADMTKFLLDESLYQGSPEEVMAKLRKKSLQLGATTVLSTGLGATKYNNALTQTAVQSAVSYDPDQPAWGQFLNFASSAATAMGTEAATKWGTGQSQKRYGEEGAFGAGMHRRDDGKIEVSSPQIAASIHEQVTSGSAVELGGSPPKYRIETPNGPIEAVLSESLHKQMVESGQLKAPPKDAPVDADTKPVVADTKPVVGDESTTVDPTTKKTPAETDPKTVIDGGPTPEKVAEITTTKKGDRPEPSTYLSPEYVAAHNEAFAEGGSRIVLKDAHDKYGTYREDGTTFLMTKADCDALIAKCGGDTALLEQELGLPAGQLSGGSGLVRIDFPPGSLTIPTGNEAGANSHWIPGGKTPNGNWEAIANKAAAGKESISPIKTGSDAVVDTTPVKKAVPDKLPPADTKTTTPKDPVIVPDRIIDVGKAPETAPEINAAKQAEIVTAKKHELTVLEMKMAAGEHADFGGDAVKHQKAIDAAKTTIADTEANFAKREADTAAYKKAYEAKQAEVDAAKLALDGALARSDSDPDKQAAVEAAQNRIKQAESAPLLKAPEGHDPLSSVAKAALDNAGSPEQKAKLEQAMQQVYADVRMRTPADVAKDANALQALIDVHVAQMDSTLAEGQSIRKVMGVDGIDQYLRGVDRDGKAANATVGGFVGDKRNTADMSPAEAIKFLGLDYDDKSFVSGGGAGKTSDSISSVVVLDFTMTKAMADQAKTQTRIPLDPVLIDAIRAKADAGDAAAAKLLPQLTPKAVEWTDPKNPYNGFGMTSHGSRLGERAEGLSVNQEMKVNGGLEIPDGAELKIKTANGHEVVVATYRVDADGKGAFVVDPGLPTKLKERFDAIQAKEAANRAADASTRLSNDEMKKSLQENHPKPGTGAALDEATSLAMTGPKTDEGVVDLRSPEEVAAAKAKRERQDALSSAETDLASAETQLRLAQASKNVDDIAQAEALVAAAKKKVTDNQPALPTATLEERQQRLLTDKAVDTANAFTTIELSKDYNERRKQLMDPNNWTPERRAFHDAMLEKAYQDALVLAAEIKGAKGDDDSATMFLMRGNTAAGKSRAVSSGEGPADLAEGIKHTGKGGRSSKDGKELQHRAVNPDAFKTDIYNEGSGLGLTAGQAHEESSILAQRLHDKLLNAKHDDGSPVDMVVDQRLAWMDQVEGLIKDAKTSNRKISLTDVDADLATSFAGVLDRNPGGDSPIPPASAIKGGFEMIRGNRLEVIKLLANEATAEYKLFATLPDGKKVLVAEMKPLGEGEVMPGNPLERLVVTKGNESMFESIVPKDPKAQQAQAEATANQKITPELIEQMTGPIADVKYREQLKKALERHMGKTWTEAVNQWGNTAPPPPPPAPAATSGK